MVDRFNIFTCAFSDRQCATALKPSGPSLLSLRSRLITEVHICIANESAATPSSPKPA